MNLEKMKMQIENLNSFKKYDNDYHNYTNMVFILVYRNRSYHD